MKWFFLLLFGPQVFAIQGSRVGSDIYLSNVPCAKTEAVLQSLKAWTETTGESFNCQSEKYQAEYDNQMCTLKVTSCVPSHVRKYQNAVPKMDGPNCWNLALVMKGILPALRFSSPEEMEFYMRPPLCQAVRSGPLKPGDIGAMRLMKGASKEEVHGFIYISEDLAYSKNGFGKSAYSLQSTKQMQAFYTELTKKSRGSSAQVETDYFRCKSMKQYLDENKNILGGLKQSLRQVEDVERCFESQSLQSSQVSTEMANNLRDVTKVLIQVVDDFKSQHQNMSDQDSFILASLYLRIDGLIGQLRRGSAPLFNEMLPLQNLLRESLSELFRTRR